MLFPSSRPFRIGLFLACGGTAACIERDKEDTGARPPDSADSGEVPPFDCADATFFGDQSEHADAGVVIGRVVSPSGAIPVVGVELHFAGLPDWTLSAEHGCFRIELPAGDTTLEGDKGRYGVRSDFTVEAGEVVDLGDLALDAGGLRVAVIAGNYDSVEVLLTNLGIPYDTFAETEDLISSSSLLEGYDAVFANCGSVTSRTSSRSFSAEDLDRLGAWVRAGGTLYASDHEWRLFEGAIPEALTFGETEAEVLRGEAGTVRGGILSRDVVQLVGQNELDITFDLPGWAVVDAADQAEVVVEALIDGTTRPLAAIHRTDPGRAVFTSFHNDHQATQEMQLVLYELILSL
jgi:hypothetical protein